MNNNRPLVDRLREALALPKIGPCFTSADFTTPEDIGITKENARLAPVHAVLVEVVDEIEMMTTHDVPADEMRVYATRKLEKLKHALAAMEAK